MKSQPLTPIAAILAAASLSASAQVLTGTIKDDSGAPISVAVTVEVHQVPQFAPGVSGRAVLIPCFSAASAADSSGGYSFASVPQGQYWICAYPLSPGYLSNCDWSVSKPRPVTIGAVAPSALPLTLAKGAIFTLDVNDPTGFIKTASLNSGHWFYPGVMNAAGAYSPARESSINGTHHFFVVTIPTTSDVSLFIDSDLTVVDSAGKTVIARAPSGIVISGKEGSAQLSFTVR